MHSAAIARLELNAVYYALPVPPTNWTAFASAARASLDGFNVTLPHKERAWESFAGAEDVTVETYAKHCGAANTAARRTDGWVLDNTDGQGFLDDLHDRRISFDGKDVVVLGAGGAARSVMFAFQLLAQESPHRLTVINRSPEKAKKLAAELDKAPRNGRFPIQAVEGAHAAEAVRRAALIVNATSAGMNPGDPFPIDPAALHGGQIVYDLIYHRETELLKAARALGLKTVGGLGMLVNQGALAFELWFRDELKNKVNYSPQSLRFVMRSAAETALKERTP